MTEKTSYSERLRDAMAESGYFASNGGQTRLAELIQCKPQALSQVLSGTSKEFSAGPHSRVCHELGVEALWLADGKGPKYRQPTGPSAHAAGEEVVVWTEARDRINMEVDPIERALLLKLRQLSRRASEAVHTIVDAIARGPV